MHERGMLEWVDHPEFGRIVLPNSPLRFHGTPMMPLVPSPQLGEVNDGVYRDPASLSDEEIAVFRATGVTCADLLSGTPQVPATFHLYLASLGRCGPCTGQIGRAGGRERVGGYVMKSGDAGQY